MVHQYKLGGYNIIIDGNSGSVHSVDDVAYDVIALYETSTPDEICDALLPKYASENLTREDIEEVLADIEELKKEGSLFSVDPFEEAAAKIKRKQSVLKAICLHVAHGCNMDCRYCFAGKGDYSGKAGIMSLEVGKRSLEYLVEQSGTRKHLEVDFFGGEPLLNWDVCKELVR